MDRNLNQTLILSPSSLILACDLRAACVPAALHPNFCWLDRRVGMPQALPTGMVAMHEKLRKTGFDERRARYFCRDSTGTSVMDGMFTAASRSASAKYRFTRCSRSCWSQVESLFSRIHFRPRHDQFCLRVRHITPLPGRPLFLLESKQSCVRSVAKAVESRCALVIVT